MRERERESQKGNKKSLDIDTKLGTFATNRQHIRLLFSIIKIQFILVLHLMALSKTLAFGAGHSILALPVVDRVTSSTLTRRIT